MVLISHMSVDFPEKRKKEEQIKKNNSCSRFILFSVHLHSLFGSVSSLTCIRSFKEMHANYHLRGQNWMHFAHSHSVLLP